MSKMNKFNKAYDDIISEGMLRKFGQMFKGKDRRQDDLNSAIDKLFTGNNLKKIDDTTFSTENGDIIFKLGKTLKDVNASSGRMKVIVKSSALLDIKQSDTLNEIASKINKSLGKQGSEFRLDYEKAIDRAKAEADSNQSLENDFN